MVKHNRPRRDAVDDVPQHGVSHAYSRLAMPDRKGREILSACHVFSASAIQVRALDDNEISTKFFAERSRSYLGYRRYDPRRRAEFLLRANKTQSPPMESLPSVSRDGTALPQRRRPDCQREAPLPRNQRGRNLVQG